METKAEEKKNLGNEEFKKGNYQKAIKLYSEAIDIKPNEAIYTNRAASQIQLKEFKKAIEDCNMALNINPNFSKAYKRLFRSYLSLGELEKAKESIIKAMTSDPNDKTNQDDMKKYENVATQERVVQRTIEQKDFESAVNYVNQILSECVASEKHCLLKLELLLKGSKLKEAVDFSRELVNNPIFQNSAVIKGARGRLLIYNGDEVEGKKQLLAALQLDPDNQEFKTAIKNIKLQNELKDEATQLFKNNKIEDAIQKFKECLEIDHLNIQYNSTIHFNLGMAYNKLKKNEDALVHLNKAIYLNPQYAKALVKRGEVNQALDNHEEALRDFQAASQIDPSGFGVQDKIKVAKQKAKEASKKDYYKILGLEKKATDDEIKKAYKKLALKWHPDRNQGSEEQKVKADKMFKDVNEAYTVLSDDKKRKRYDLGGYDPSEPDGGMGGHFSEANIDPNEIFKMFFQTAGGGGGGMSSGMGGGMGGFPGGGGFSFPFGEEMFGGGQTQGSRGGSAFGSSGMGGFPGFTFMSGGMPGGMPGAGRGGRGQRF